MRKNINKSKFITKLYKYNYGCITDITTNVRLDIVLQEVQLFVGYVWLTTYTDDDGILHPTRIIYAEKPEPGRYTYTGKQRKNKIN